MIKLVKNNSGITLVELLAGITISAIVIVLLSNVLITSFRHHDQAQSHIDLRKEANLIVTELRSAHSAEPFELCHLNNQLLLNNRKLSRDSVLVENLSIYGEPFEYNTDSGCIVVDSKVPLPIHFTLNDENNNAFELETVLHRLKGDSEVSVTVP